MEGMVANYLGFHRGVDLGQYGIGSFDE